MEHLVPQMHRLPCQQWRRYLPMHVQHKRLLNKNRKTKIGTRIMKGFVEEMTALRDNDPPVPGSIRYLPRSSLKLKVQQWKRWRACMTETQPIPIDLTQPDNKDAAEKVLTRAVYLFSAPSFFSHRYLLYGAQPRPNGSLASTSLNRRKWNRRCLCSASFQWCIS